LSGPSISFDGREPVDNVLAKADAAVKAGVGSIWLACHLFQRDPITTASVLLGRHPTLDIVLVAISPYVMHPVHAAMSAATLDEFFPGRVSLCLGAGAPADLASVGVTAERPLAAMREALTLCRRLFAGETVVFEGERFAISGRALGSGMCAVPLLLAASGPKMLRLAGSAADGVLLSAGASPEFIAWSLEQVEAGDPPSDFLRCGLVYGLVDSDQALARDRVRGVLATVLRGDHHAHNLALAGSQLDQPKLRASETPEALITDDIVDRHAAAGTPDAFRQRVDAYRAAGLDAPIFASMRTPAQIAALATALNGSE